MIIAECGMGKTYSLVKMLEHPRVRAAARLYRNAKKNVGGLGHGDHHGTL